PVTVRFDITDTSPGLTPKQQIELFQPTADMSRSDGGLGLPIAQRIAEAMGGEVSCDSAMGQGALYWFTFQALVDERPTETPVAQLTSAYVLELGAEDAVAPEEPEPLGLDAQSVQNESTTELAVVPDAEPLAVPMPEPAAESASEVVPEAEATHGHEGALAGHVLMIEDNTVNRLLIGAYLDEFGLTYDVAETGAAALICLDQRPYDLVLMDTVLPDYRGLQLVQRIRSQESVFAHVPIVALATLSDNEDEKTYVEAGVNASVDKPIRGAELYAALVPLVPAKQDEVEDEAWTPVY
ncbi:MAG: response regulator, partial [Pseudomonadota bacterium]